MTPLRDGVYLPLIPVIRLVDALHAAPVDPAPMRDPAESLREIRDAAGRILPGARLRRRLMWRYTLVWQAPGEM